MKKTLSLLLVLAMVLSSFGFAFAAEDKVVPAEFLNKKGILKGNAEGDLMLDKNLKRQDMIIMLSRLLGVEDEAKAFEGKTSFTDVADSFYVPYIAWAEAKELTNGKAEGKFGFDEPVTVQQVAQFMLRALGYGEVKWDEVPAKAVELGLVEKGADLTVDAKRSVLAEITYKALGTKMKDSDKTLAEHLSVELPVPAKLEVKEVRADNLKEIKVVFNKKLNAEQVEDKDLYSTTVGAIRDAKLVEEENAVRLTLDDTVEMKNKKEYKVTIKGLKDGDNVIDETFTFKAYDNTVPEVVEVVGLGTKAVKVIMSEPIKNAASKNFKLDGKAYYGSVDKEGRELILKPYGSDLSVADHKLVVLSLEDFAGFKSTEKELEFTVVEDKEAPTVVDVKGTLERVVVTFSEDVDKSTVSKDSLYWGGDKANKAERVVRLSGNRYAFEFSREKALPTYEVKLTIKGVKDYSGNEIKETEVPFKAAIDETRPEVLKVTVDDEKTIIVKFTKSVDKDDVNVKKNYVITDEDGKAVSIKKITLDKGQREAKIEIYNELKENKSYTLKISGIRDNTKMRNTMLPYETKISAGNYKNPEVSAVTSNNKERKIHVLFNKKMDVASIANPVNYMIVYKDAGKDVNRLLSAIDGDVDVVQDGKAVVLTLPEKIDNKTVGESKKLEIGKGKEIHSIIVLGVQDTDENILKEYGKTIAIDNAEVIVKKAVATGSKKIELTFSQPIVKADEDDFVPSNGFKIDKVVVNGTNKVVIETVKDLHAGLKDVDLKIKEDHDIESVLETVISKEYVNKWLKGLLNKGIVDEIAPSIDEAKGVKNDADKVLDIHVTFDEDLCHEGIKVADYAKDLTIVRYEGNKELDPKSDYEVVGFATNKEGKEVYTTIIVRISKAEIYGVKSDYEITIKKPVFIRDVAENIVNETEKPVIVSEVDGIDEMAKNVEKTEYTKIKVEVEKNVKAYETAAKDLSDLVKVNAAKDAKKAIKLDGLKAEDKATFEARIKVVDEKVAEAEEKLGKDSVEAKKFAEASIIVIPDEVKLSDKAKVTDARAAVDAAKAKGVKEEEIVGINKLTEAEAKIADLEAQAAVETEAAKITVEALGEIKVADEETVLKKAQSIVTKGYTVSVKEADGEKINSEGKAISTGEGYIIFTVTKDDKVADTGKLVITVAE